MLIYRLLEQSVHKEVAQCEGCHQLIRLSYCQLQELHMQLRQKNRINQRSFLLHLQHYLLHYQQQLLDFQDYLQEDQIKLYQPNQIQDQRLLYIYLLLHEQIVQQLILLDRILQLLQTYFHSNSFKKLHPIFHRVL